MGSQWVRHSFATEWQHSLVEDNTCHQPSVQLKGMLGIIYNKALHFTEAATKTQQGQVIHLPSAERRQFRAHMPVGKWTQKLLFLSLSRMWDQSLFYGSDNQDKSLTSDFKIHILGISLVVQWLRLLAPNAGGPGSIPDQGTRSHMLQLKVHICN